MICIFNLHFNLNLFGGSLLCLLLHKQFILVKIVHALRSKFQFEPQNRTKAVKYFIIHITHLSEVEYKI